MKLKDGAEVTVPTDLSWKSYPSPVTFSNIYDGEHYDARREVPGWSQNGCQAQASGVLPGTEKAEKLMARLGPKIVKKASFTPTVLHTKRGETVLDFGQNMTGWVEFDVSEPAGTEVVLTYGEVLQDGCFYRDNLRSAKAEYRYISKGEKAPCAAPRHLLRLPLCEGGGRLPGAAGGLCRGAHPLGHRPHRLH